MSEIVFLRFDAEHYISIQKRILAIRECENLSCGLNALIVSLFEAGTGLSNPVMPYTHSIRNDYIMELLRQLEGASFPRRTSFSRKALPASRYMMI